MSTGDSTARNLSRQRCFNHFQREAAARCVECGQFFCRECIAEHDDRIVCAACLVKLVRRPGAKRRRFAGALRIGQCALGLFLLWFFFYLAGQNLIRIPTSFHEGTLWHNGSFDSP